MSLGFKIPEQGSLDLLSLGAMVHRLDPGIIPFRKATQFAVHCAAADAGLFNNLLRVLELLVDLVEDDAESLEFGLDPAEDLPDFARTLLDRQRSEAHPQRGQQRD